jgi:hypothetical protein
VVVQRYRHDILAINAMVERAEAVASGKRPLKRDRFVKVTDADPVVDCNLVERAQQRAGLKGYADVSVIPTSIRSVLVSRGREANLVGIEAPAGSGVIVPQSTLVTQIYLAPTRPSRNNIEADCRDSTSARPLLTAGPVAAILRSAG